MTIYYSLSRYNNIKTLITCLLILTVPVMNAFFLFNGKTGCIVYCFVRTPVAIWILSPGFQRYFYLHVKEAMGDRLIIASPAKGGVKM